MQGLPFEPLESRALLAPVVESVNAPNLQLSALSASMTYGGSTIALITTNTAPTLVGANHLNAIYEDDTAQPGTRIASLVEGFTTDPDGPALGIAVTAASDANGTWQFATDGVTWQSLGVVSDANSRLLNADTDTRIRFVPNADYNGTVANALSFRAWDGFNGGIEGALSNTTVNGGTTPFSTATASSSIIVYGLADGPRFTIADTTITLNKDATAQAIDGFVTSFAPGSTNPAITGSGYAPAIHMPGMSVDIVDVATIPQSIDPNTGTLKPARTNFTYFAPGDTGRLFVNDMRGKLWIIQNGTLLSTPFLDIPAVRGVNWIDNSSSINSERGFSTFAFHPDFNNNTKPGYRKVYTVHTESPDSAARGDFDSPSGTTAHYDVLSEWTVDASNPNVIDTTSRREILRLAQPLVDHNMNQVAFNPTATPGSADFGKLYIGVGDGGNTGNVRPTNIVDQYNDGQNRRVPFGKILRIDPFGNDASNGKYGIPADNPFVATNDPDSATLDEIWAVGLRNPQRFSWDAVTGKMLISDIGQKNAEEINLGVAGSNYGWSEREGMFVVDHTSGSQTKAYGRPSNDASFGYTYPVATYDRSDGIAIVGGFVYRGSAIPYLQGKYIFGDLNTGKIYFADVNDLVLGAQTNIQELTLFSGDTQKTLLQILGGGATRTDLRFGLDASGEIYLTSKFDGKVRRLAARAQPATWTPPAALPVVSGAPNIADGAAFYYVSNLTNASLFSVAPAVASNGTLTFTPAPNATGTAEFTLTAQDAGGTAFGRIDTAVPQTITIRIVAPNRAPTDITLSSTSVAENAAIGTAVGTLSTTDVDAGDSFTYSLVTGTGSTDNAAFSISGNQLETAARFNYEAKNSYSIRIRSTDASGLFVEKQVTIGVLDTTPPGVQVTSSAAKLRAGETATVTFTLSEVSTNFAVGDVSVTGGLLSHWAPGSGTSFTATFTPTANVMTVGTIWVAANTFTDAAGNGNTAGSLTQAIAIDTALPAAPTIWRVGAAVVVTGLEADATWQYSLDSGATWQAGSGGLFGIPAVDAAPNQIQVTQTTTGGNRSLVSRLADGIKVAATPISTRSFDAAVSQKDMRAQAMVDLATGTGVGLYARYSVVNGKANLYRASLSKSGAGFNATIFRYAAGVPAVVKTVSAPSGNGLLEFNVVGTTLSLFLDGKLLACVIDNSVTGPGTAGTYVAAGATATQFLTSVLTEATSLSTKSFDINVSQRDMRVQAMVDVTTGTGAGLYARYSVLNGKVNFYQAYLRKAGSGYLATIVRYADGISAVVANVAAPAGKGLLQLDTIGSTISLALDGKLLVALTDTAVTGPGRAGTYISSGSSASQFSISRLASLTPPAAPTISRVGAAVVVTGLEADATWQYSLDNGATWQAGSGGLFGIPAVDAAPNQIQVTQTDTGGNRSLVSRLADGIKVAATPISTRSFDAAVSQKDMRAQAMVDLATGTGVGLYARYSVVNGKANLYRASLSKSGAGFNATIFRYAAGVAAVVKTVSAPSGNGLLEFNVVGTTLSLFLDGKLLACVIDNSVTGPGTAGTYVAAGATATQFLTSVLTEATSLSTKSFDITVSQRDMRVQAMVDVTTGTGAGLYARYSVLNGKVNFYQAYLRKAGSGYLATIVRYADGISAVVANVAAPAGKGLLQLDTIGSTISLALDGKLLVALTDTAVTGPGRAGTYVSSGSSASQFSISRLAAFSS